MKSKIGGMSRTAGCVKLLSKLVNNHGKNTKPNHDRDVSLNLIKYAGYARQTSARFLSVRGLTFELTLSVTACGSFWKPLLKFLIRISPGQKNSVTALSFKPDKTQLTVAVKSS